MTEPITLTLPISPPTEHVGVLAWPGRNARRLQKLLDVRGDGEASGDPKTLFADLTVWAACTNADFGRAVVDGVNDAAGSLASVGRSAHFWTSDHGVPIGQDEALAAQNGLEALSRLTVLNRAVVPEGERAGYERTHRALETHGFLSVIDPSPAVAESELATLAHYTFMWASTNEEPAGPIVADGIRRGRARIGSFWAGDDRYWTTVDDAVTTLQRLARAARPVLGAARYLEELAREAGDALVWNAMLNGLWKNAVLATPADLPALLRRCPALAAALPAEGRTWALEHARPAARPGLFSVLGRQGRAPRTGGPR